jgi:hypothetical protein
LKQEINDKLNLEIDLFNCKEDEFIYLYLALGYEVKKELQNAFYTGYTKRIIKNKRPFMTHKEEIGYITLEIHPLDVYENREYIKTILQQNRSKNETAKR